jgi:hypothetical protein
MLSRHRRGRVIALIGVMSVALVCTCVFVLRALTKQAPRTDLYAASADESRVDATANGLSSEPVSLAESKHSPEGDPDPALPADIRAMTRWYAEPGRRHIEDAEVIWQKREDNYRDYLRQESFAQSAFRTYIMNELVLVLCNYPNFEPSNPDTIRIHARTRRYCKLIYEIEQARIAGELSSIVQTLSDTVDRFIAERKRVEKEVLALIEEKPELVRPGRGDYHEVNLLIAGVGLMGPGVSGFNVPDPEKAIPRSITGTQLGVLANTFLLGLTHDSRAVAPLLRVAGYDSKPFLEKYEEAIGMRPPLDHRLANPWAVVDALDRILMSDATQATGSPTGTVARDYAQWRSGQSWPLRETVEIYPFDAPQTPYSLPGMVTGRLQEVETRILALPLKVSVDGRPGLTEADVEKILEWAHRYHQAQQ